MTETASLLAAPASLVAESPHPEDVGRYVCHFGDFRTGELWGTLPVSGFTWTSELGATGATQASVPASPQASALWSSLEAGPALTAVEWARSFGRRILWASPVVSRGLGADLSLGGSGIFGHLGRRLLIPNVAADQVAANSLTYSGMDRGSIMRSLVAQALAMPQGDLPIVLEPVRTGTRTATFDGFDLATVAQRINDLTDNVPVTDFAFLPRFADSRYLSVVWDMLTGSEAQPQLNRASDVPIIVDGTAPGQTTVKSLSWEESVGDTGTHFYAKGGGTEGGTVIRGAVDSTLTGRGWARMDVVTTNDSEDGDVVQDYANGAMAQRKRALRGIKAEVDAAFWWSQDARLGDSVRVMFNHPIAGRIDITSRLLSESGDVSSSSVALTFADTLAED